MSLRETLLSATARVVTIAVAGIGDVYIRQLTGREFDSLRESMMSKGKVSERGMMARFIIASVCDPDGTLSFTAGDLPKVNEIPLPVLLPVFKAIQDANGLGKDDTDELVGKSDATMPSGSGTD